MTDEAFALSPISARPVMPSDADYDAIREAFMETSRGRWFLTEYAKRNRNADTSMVLDAVARIEQTLAAQKQAHAEAAVESLAAIRAVIGEARASVAKAIATLDDTATLVAAHRGARAISEVASTLRECGADSRICDLLDQQVAAIDSGHRLVAGIDRDAIDAAFDRMLLHVAAISGVAPEAAANRAAPETTAAAAPAATPAMDEPAAAPQTFAEPEAVAPQPAVAEPVPPQAVAPQAAVPEAAEPASAPQAQAAPAFVVVKGTPSEELEFVEAEDQTPVPAAVAVAPAEAPAAVGAAEQSEAAHLLDEVVALDAEGLEDDAVLDLVAREMSAPEVSEPYRPEDDAYAAAAASTAAEIESDIAALQQALSEEIAVSPEPMAIDDAPDSAAEAFEPEPEAAFEPVGEMGEAALMEAEPIAIHAAAAPVAMATAAVAGEVAAAAPASLGAAAIASGAVAAPPPMRSDALVPIRRMSQAEKIAFFS
ncbi:hypothetical protein [Rhodopseudomonas sp.]|uniref:hypothetical protein n=1 Tax=Rhodopseudomonas sp. TaxID=1078 RepID=UPI0039E3805B